jgi:hypothetical protein
MDEKEQCMFRKLLVVAAAIAMPVSVIAVTGATAGAKTPVPPNNPVSCKIGATVTFAFPGLSNNGAVSTGKTSATTTTGTAVSGAGCSGTGGNPLTITSKNLKCSKSTPNSPVPGCIKGDTYYDTWNQFISNGTASVLKSVKKLTINVNGVTYSIKGTSVNESPPCGSEVGFGIGGVVTAPKNDKGQAVTLNACLGSVTGTGLNSYSNFAADISGPGVMTTAQIDSTVSTLSIGS